MFWLISFIILLAITVVPFPFVSVQSRGHGNTKQLLVMKRVSHKNILELAQLSGFNFGELGLDTLPR